MIIVSSKMRDLIKHVRSVHPGFGDRCEDVVNLIISSGLYRYFYSYDTSHFPTDPTEVLLMDSEFCSIYFKNKNRTLRLIIYDCRVELGFMFDIKDPDDWKFMIVKITYIFGHSEFSRCEVGDGYYYIIDLKIKKDDPKLIDFLKAFTIPYAEIPEKKTLINKIIDAFKIGKLC